MSNKLKFEDKGKNCHVAFFEVERTTPFDGRSYKTQEAARAIKEIHLWRIDRTMAVISTWMPWEAIDSHGYATLKQAKDAIRAYVTRIQAGLLR